MPPPAGAVAKRTPRPPEEALRQSEKIYRTLIESLPQRVFFKDCQSAFISVNAAFAADYQLRPEEFAGKTDYDFFPKELAEKYRADDQRIMAQRQSETLEEANIGDGKMRIIECVKTPVLDDDGQVMGLLGIFTDITERKVAEEKLREFSASLERSNRELQDFAYVASHDLQEPLRKVTVFGDRLRTKCGVAMGAEGCDYLDRMQKAAGRMQNLINDLLTFSRVTNKPQPFVPVDLGKIAREVMEDLEARIEQTGAQVEVGALPVIEAVPLQMRQLLQNLVGNALKFQRPGEKPVVTIAGEILRRKNGGSTRNAPAREWLQLTVRDNGIGFDEKYLDRIFNVFQRLHSRAEYEGTGMGLAITRKIVEHHGGKITARSQPGQGAAFLIDLPMKQRKAHEPL